MYTDAAISNHVNYVCLVKTWVNLGHGDTTEHGLYHEISMHQSIKLFEYVTVLPFPKKDINITTKSLP